MVYWRKNSPIPNGESVTRRGKCDTAPALLLLRRVRRPYTLRKNTVALAPSPSCPPGLAEDEWHVVPRAGPLAAAASRRQVAPAHQLAIFSNAFADAHRAPRSFNNHERCACSLEPAHASAQLKRRRRSTGTAPFEYYRRGAAKAGVYSPLRRLGCSGSMLVLITRGSPDARVLPSLSGYTSTTGLAVAHAAHTSSNRRRTPSSLPYPGTFLQAPAVFLRGF